MNTLWSKLICCSSCWLGVETLPQSEVLKTQACFPPNLSDIQLHSSTSTAFKMKKSPMLLPRAEVYVQWGFLATYAAFRLPQKSILRSGFDVTPSKHNLRSQDFNMAGNISVDCFRLVSWTFWILTTNGKNTSRTLVLSDQNMFMVFPTWLVVTTNIQLLWVSWLLLWVVYQWMFVT